MTILLRLSFAVLCAFSLVKSNKIKIHTPRKFEYRIFPVSGDCVTFEVRAKKDAIVCLTSGPKAVDPMIDIVIGGSDNTRSFIRKNSRSHNFRSVKTSGILNGGKYRGFWIRWNAGVVKVGRKGEAVEFLSYKPHRLHPINYVGVSTWEGASGRWIIDTEGNGTDCQAPSSPSTPKTDLPEGARPQIGRGTDSLVLTNSTKVIQTLDNSQYQFFPVKGVCFTFKVRAPHGAQVTLAAGQEKADPKTEIIIGGWFNSVSVISKNRQHPSVVVGTPGILDAGEFRGFWILWFSGVINVGREGDTKAFMSYKDPHSHPINFVGISTGWGASGFWIIDTDGNGDC